MLPLHDTCSRWVAVGTIPHSTSSTILYVPELWHFHFMPTVTSSILCSTCGCGNKVKASWQDTKNRRATSDSKAPLQLKLVLPLHLTHSLYSKLVQTTSRSNQRSWAHAPRPWTYNTWHWQYLLADRKHSDLHRDTRAGRPPPSIRFTEEIWTLASRDLAPDEFISHSTKVRATTRILFMTATTNAKRMRSQTFICIRIKIPSFIQWKTMGRKTHRHWKKRAQKQQIQWHSSILKLTWNLLSSLLQLLVFTVTSWN